MRWLRRTASAILALALCACALSYVPGPGNPTAEAQLAGGDRQVRINCPGQSPINCDSSLDPGKGDGGKGQGGGGKGDGGQGQGAGQGNGGGGNNNGGGGGGGGGNGGGLSDSNGDVGTGDDEPGGTANPLSFSNPLCKRLSPKLRERCRFAQGPETLVPATNYGLDIYADDSGSGTDAIVGNFQKMLGAVANGIWMVMLMALKGVFALLGWAFSLAPFSNGTATSKVDSGLENFYDNFTSPWLAFGFVCLGAWAMYRGVIKREAAQTIGGLLLSVVLMLLALWVIHEPKASIGRASDIVDTAALSVIAAPQSGSLANPVADYGQATSRAWSAYTTAPWTALQFSDASWALGPPDEDLKAYIWDDEERFCDDARFAGDEQKCQTFRALYGEPKSNVDLLLAASPGSPARSDEMWNEGFGDDHQDVIAKMSPQSGGGAWTRFPIVGLFAIGLLGALLLLMWIAIRLFVQTAVAFVLVLSTPVALFFPAFGEKGRAAFKFWGGTLIGAIVAKLVYAALLAIVLFGVKVIYGMVGSGDEGISVMMGFLLAAAFNWAIFLKRQEIAGFFSLSDKDEGGAGRLGNIAGAYAAYRLGQSLIGQGRGGLGRRGAQAGAFGQGAPGQDGGEAPPRTVSEAQAQRQLDGRAHERLENEYTQAQGTLAAAAERGERQRDLRESARRQRAHAEEFEQLRKRTGDPARQERYAAAAERSRRRSEAFEAQAEELEAEAKAEQPRLREAQGIVDRADRNERISGRRFSEHDIRQSREAIRQNLNDKPVEHGANAHYVGMSPREYESLEGPKRLAAHQEVAKKMKADEKAFGVIPDQPGGAPGSRAKRRAYTQASTEALGPQGHTQAKHEALRAAAGERRSFKRLRGARQLQRNRKAMRRRGISR
jgi:hypothetical protein